MDNVKTRFDYLMNALEQAASTDNPAANGYSEKRKALYDYVRALEKVDKAAREFMQWGRPEDLAALVDDWDALGLALDDVVANAYYTPKGQ